MIRAREARQLFFSLRSGSAFALSAHTTTYQRESAARLGMTSLAAISALFPGRSGRTRRAEGLARTGRSPRLAPRSRDRKNATFELRVVARVPTFVRRSLTRTFELTRTTRLLTETERAARSAPARLVIAAEAGGLAPRLLPELRSFAVLESSGVLLVPDEGLAATRATTLDEGLAATRTAALLDAALSALAPLLSGAPSAKMRPNTTALETAIAVMARIGDACRNFTDMVGEPAQRSSDRWLAT